MILRPPGTQSLDGGRHSHDRIWTYLKGIPYANRWDLIISERYAAFADLLRRNRNDPKIPAVAETIIFTGTTSSPYRTGAASNRCGIFTRRHMLSQLTGGHQVHVLVKLGCTSSFTIGEHAQDSVLPGQSISTQSAPGSFNESRAST